jgi:hypothetical protein
VLVFVRFGERFRLHLLLGHDWPRIRGQGFQSRGEGVLPVQGQDSDDAILDCIGGRFSNAKSFRSFCNRVVR